MPGLKPPAAEVLPPVHCTEIDPFAVRMYGPESCTPGFPSAVVEVPPLPTRVIEPAPVDSTGPPMDTPRVPLFAFNCAPVTPPDPVKWILPSTVLTEPRLRTPPDNPSGIVPVSVP